MIAAWYGHLKFKNTILWKVILISWMIAFVEYCFQVPANRIGHSQFSAAQLKIIQEVMRENASAVNDYKKGKESALQFLVGQGMKATRGAGNPQVFMSLFLEALK